MTADYEEKIHMKIVAIIPARLASVRFQGKVLFPFHGLPMIEHVRRRALMSMSVVDVYVATCDDEIAEAVRKFGGKVIMTASTHKNGTTRIAEAISDIDCTHVILLQGDEPLLLPRHLDSVINAIKSEPVTEAWNATGSLENADELDRHSFVKCSLGFSNQILYCFRRSPGYSEFEKQNKYMRKMFGIMAYRKDFLMKLTSLPESIIERYESIEQMRIIEHGYTIKSIDVEPSLLSVNEPAEVDLVLTYLQENEEQGVLLRKVLSYQEAPA